MGFSADIDIAGSGAGSSLSVNGGKTNVNADYKAVGEQSGIFTGDGGIDLTTEGTTNLIGGAITTTDKALQDGLNTYVRNDPCRQIRITKLGRFLSRRLTVNQTTSGLAIGSPTLIMKQWDKILED